MTKILIGGDICPIGHNQTYFKKGDAKNLFNDLLPYFESADLNIANLECPLIERSTPMEKTGPILSASSGCIKGFKNAGIQVLGLANNHMKDHGEPGLFDTLRTVHENGIHTVGAGKNLIEAESILSLNIDGLNIGIIAVAENEWSIATSDSAGANPIDVISFSRMMRERRNDFDYIVVLYHGGYQHYPYPTPNQQKIARFMIEEGANAVVCQHSHCPGCYEEYGGGHIVYGQGNFIFAGKTKSPKSWFQGFLVELEVDKNNIKFIPYEQSLSRPGAYKMNAEQSKSLLDGIRLRSEQIQDPDFVYKEWNRFCQGKRYRYYSKLRGHSKLLRILNRYIHFSDWFYTRKKEMVLSNILRCESHREMLETILNNQPKDGTK